MKHEEHGHSCVCHEHSHSHSHEHVITPGSKCCSSCGTEPKKEPSCSCSSEKTGTKSPDDTGENDEDGQPHSCSCCEQADMFEETEDNSDSFKKEIRQLLAIGAIFAATLIYEHFFKTENNGGIIFALYALLYLASGIPVLKEMFFFLKKGDIFNEFTLMGFASLAALAIGAASESVGVMLFYRLGEAFQEKAASNSRKSIRSLLARKPSCARVITAEGVKEAALTEIVKGDRIQVLPGEQIPADGIIVSGSSYLDTSSITGESLPLSASCGTKVSGGFLALDGMIIVEASGPFEDSAISRVLEMVQYAASRKSPVEKFITKFAKWYTPSVFAIAFLTALILPLATDAEFSDSLYKALVLLVVSCPCALVISIPLGYFGGIGAASKRGILVKGAYVFDAAKNIKTAVFDKTGTLTEGVFKVIKIVPADGTSKEDLLTCAALAECASTHPIAKSISAEAGITVPPEGAEISQIPGKGVKYENGQETIYAGSAAFISDITGIAHNTEERGTSVHVLRNGIYAGYILLADSLKKDSLSTAQKLRKSGIGKIYMLTGDRRAEAKRVSHELALDGYEAELLPDEKVYALEKISHGALLETMFVGDGINDAPVLASAGIGVAMGGLGSRTAVEAADAVILDDSPSKAADLITIAAKTRGIVRQNIAAALGIKLLFIVLGVSGEAGLWEAVFADVGVALLAVLNASRAAKI